jgi:hypothetical protein
VAAETRQCKIEDNESRHGLFDLPKRIRPIFDGDNDMPGRAQRHPVHFPQLRIVLDNEYPPPRRRCTHGPIL